MKRLSTVLFTLLPFCATWQLKADINPVVEYTSTSTLSDARPFTIGYEFALSSTFDITALGYWNDGLGNNHQVGIWDSVGNLLASTTVLSTDPIVDHFQYDSIPDLILGPGTYVIGGELYANGNSDPFPWDPTGLITQPGYTWIQDEQVYGPGLNFPNASYGGYGDNGILAVDFATGTPAAVPEPTTVLPILIIGMCLVLGVRRKLRAGVTA